ncbi:FAD-binding domain-containing protein [Mycena albidolilacea]|uniref:FAD-binding domain-containing protein n=1 Tax=Mycena albidolilacea TaxID=1033008 RepID=A0AAD7F2Z9_9AGAR|nr:FAD-binding domain-containing protein [Mycena albidolilacea]
MGANNMLLCQIFFCVISFITTLAQETPNNSSIGTASVSSDTQLVSASSLACAAIQLDLGSSVVEYSGSEYSATVQGPWSLFNSLDRPTCIVYPRAASHVQVAMSKIFSFGSQYAVQAGAHSAMVGWNSISDGVLISFAHMTNTSYNPLTDTVTVQPGVHWGDAIAAVEPYGVSVIGGRASDIGTGLLLGGGISFISPLYGWSADSIKEVDVVLVTGESVTANATNKFSDLFRALKGGANRFGIATRYELYAAHTGTKEDKDWFGGSIVYPESSSVALSNASARYIREVTDPKAGLIVLMQATNLTPVDANVIIYLFYKGGSLPTNIFGDFLSIPNTSTSLSPLSYYDISNLISGSGRGNGQQFGASSWTGDEATFLNGYNHFMNFTRTFETDLLAADLIISPIPRSQWTANKSRGLNAIGDPGVAYAAINFNLIYPTGVTVIPERVNAGFQLLLSQASSSPGLPLYINECDASQNVFKTYPNFSALQKTYAKYDPSRFNVRHTAGLIGL